MDASTSGTSMPPLVKGNGDCFHYQTGNSPLSRNGSSVSGSLRSGPWKLYEDQLLADAVKRIGPHNWTRVAACVPGRSGKSCRLRWCNQLNPHVNKAKFSPWEQAVVHHALSRFGGKWALIAQLLPGRTDNSVKNFWNCAAKKNPTHPVCLNNKYLKSEKSLEELLEEGPPKESLESSKTAARNFLSKPEPCRSNGRDSISPEYISMDESFENLACAQPSSQPGEENCSTRSMETFFANTPAVLTSNSGLFNSSNTHNTGSRCVEPSELHVAAEMMCGQSASARPAQHQQTCQTHGGYTQDVPRGSDLAHFYEDVACLVGHDFPEATEAWRPTGGMESMVGYGMCADFSRPAAPPDFQSSPFPPGPTTRFLCRQYNSAWQ